MTFQGVVMGIFDRSRYTDGRYRVEIEFVISPRSSEIITIPSETLVAIGSKATITIAIEE